MTEPNLTIPLEFFKSKNSQKEKWTETSQEIWLVENGEKIKLIGKNENLYKELIAEKRK
ncbi:hypothetical protein [endosymbiont GvMRE of Glomus versiforme]|uniref:hypothetical protein n=1 Tax=endosymbiont GvMRE of Glomus versiforme TaxID=2039283 RepID=UPI000EE5937A|nr:hypothetical protein [endosymbiont GvMRE of Glomus versiforme]RHZ35787.1 hypothetical protein GvMRE_Ic5g5 [endosymbiont GvMRE of Glomus versiforme]